MAKGVEPIAGDRALPAVTSAAPSRVGKPQGQFHGTPGTLVIGKNTLNTRADDSTCGTNSSLSEPAAANEGNRVYYTGNLRHQEFATDGGTVWTCAAAYPAGPADAPIAFGDTDVIYDAARGVTFHSVLYVNSAVTNGVIRIFVRRNITLADNCSYTIDLSTGTELPDYPHLGISDDFLYVSANRLTPTAWTGAFMRRFNLDQMADCVTAATNSVNFTGPVGQRIIVPGHGARDVMYWFWVENTSTLRIFSWPEDSTTISQTLKTVSAMSFFDADCRGGTNNVDWADNLQTHIVGFSNRMAIGNDFISAFIAVANDASHPHVHVHGAVFRIGATPTSQTLVQQPVIFLTDRCVGIPVAGANDRGDIGISLALGGRKGGGGPAVTTGVMMKDQFNPGPGGFFIQPIAAATHNPTRYGDYTTVRRQAPCGLWFSATGYGLVNGTAAANVNARYVEFGRGRDEQCYRAWMNAIPAT